MRTLITLYRDTVWYHRHPVWGDADSDIYDIYPTWRACFMTAWILRERTP